MSKSDLELRLTRWLDDGPTGAPSDVVDAALNEARQESQAGVVGFPWLRARPTTSAGYGSIARAAVGAVVVVVVVAVVLWGVNSSPIPPAASPTPSRLVPPSHQPSPSPTDTATATAEPSPSQVTSSPSTRPSSGPTSGEGLVIAWKNPRGVSGLNDLVRIMGSAQLGDRLVISGSRLIDDGVPNFKGITTYEAPALWWSDDGLAWHLAQLPSGYEGRQFSIRTIEDVTAGGPGFVALGASLPLWSVDGQTWSSSTGAGVPYPGRLSAVGATSDGLIAYGFDSAVGGPIAVQSRDGRDWQRADDLAPRLAGSKFVQWMGGLMLLASQAEGSGTDVWRVDSLDSWVKLGTIDDGVGAVAVSPMGLVAFGAVAWVSSDGVSWVRAHNAPTGGIEASAGTSVGYVAITARSTGGGCVIELSGGETWTSVDGLDWQPGESLDWWFDELLVNGGTLIGIASPSEQDGVPAALIRVAVLPVAKPDGRPAPTPTVTPTPLDLPGCG